MSEIRRERRVLGRYLLADSIASGGMATIHLGRLLGPVGFARTVAIKRLHPQFAKDPEFVAAFLDEARLAARIQHPNVAQTLDVVATDGELFLVMEYVVGESMSQLLKRLRKRDTLMPPRIASAIVTNVLYGLHAAHEAKNEAGDPLAIVHRDVSPHNILVGVDGVARVVDFGIAKAAKRTKETEVGRIKGKIAYMSPEQVKSERLDRRSDVFSAGIVLWEALTGRRLFEDTDPFLVMSQILEAPVTPPSRHVPGLSTDVDVVVMRALARSRQERFATAREMAIAIERVLPPALQREVGEWVEGTVGDELRRRGQALEQLQREESDGSEPAAVAASPMDASDATADYQHSIVAEIQAPAEPPTEVTTPMRVEPAPRQEGERSARTALIGIVAGAVLFTGLVVVAITSRGEGEATPVVTVSNEPSVEVPASDSGAAIVDAAATIADAELSIEDLDAEPPVGASGKKPEPKPTPGPRPPKPPPASCNPPYWVDGEGIKHYKKECNLGK